MDQDDTAFLLCRFQEQDLEIAPMIDIDVGHQRILMQHGFPPFTPRIRES
jgi:hypothetical protein